MKRPLAIALAVFALSACDLEELEADKLDSMKLDPIERAVAEAFVEGLKKETNSPILRSRDYGRAACYAKSVDMPSRHHNVHKLYLADYTVIDKDYYAWFQRQGVGEQEAWDIGQRIQAGLKECSLGALIKKRLND